MAGRVEHWLKGAVRAGRSSVDNAGQVVRWFRGENLALRASALTYITLLSLVPALAVVFTVMSAVKQDALRDVLHRFIFDNLAPSIKDQIGDYVDTFVVRASGGALGTIGAIGLLLSAITLLKNIEDSFNAIWGTKRQRPILHRALVYWAFLTLGPVALAVSLSAMRGVGPAAAHFGVPGALRALVPLGITVMLWTLIYRLAPNARVHFLPAFCAALIAGSAWELAKNGFAIYVSHNLSYAKIYGALGAIPLFLLWIYVSWLLVLFGARLAYALQQTHRTLGDGVRLGPREQTILCARILGRVGRAFEVGSPPPSVVALAEEMGVACGLVRQAAELLREAGVLAEGARGGLIPGRTPAKLSLYDVAVAVERAQARVETSPWRMGSPEAFLAEHLERADAASDRALAEVSWHRIEEIERDAGGTGRG